MCILATYSQAITQTTVFTCSCRSPRYSLDGCLANPPFPPAPHPCCSLDLTSQWNSADVNGDFVTDPQGSRCLTRNVSPVFPPRKILNCHNVSNHLTLQESEAFLWPVAMLTVGLLSWSRTMMHHPPAKNSHSYFNIFFLSIHFKKLKQKKR